MLNIIGNVLGKAMGISGSSVSIPVFSINPVISGANHTVGVTLTSTSGTASGSPVYTYQWRRSGVDVGGEVATTYVAVAADSDYGVATECAVTATNIAGSVTAIATYSIVTNPVTQFSRYWEAATAFKDTAGTIPATSGQGIQRINDKVGTSHLLLTATLLGKCQKINETYYGDWKANVATVSLTNITLSGEQTIGGVLTSASRILVAGQTDQTTNGIYVTAAGAWSRATDANTSLLTANLAVISTGGTTTTDHRYWMNSRGTLVSPFTLGSSNVTLFDMTGQAGYHSDPYPEWRPEDGAFYHIRNTLPQRFEVNTLTALMGTGTGYALFYIHPTGGTDNEPFFATSNGPYIRDRDAGTGNTTQVGSFNTVVTLSTGGRLFPTAAARKGVMAVVRDASQNLQVMYDLANWGENAAGSGAGNWSNMTGGGFNNHPQNVNMHCCAVVSGAYSSTVAGRFKKYCEFTYGTSGTPSRDFPSGTFLVSGTYNDQETWNSGDKSWNLPAYTFYSPLGLSEGASELRMYTSNSATQDPGIEQRTYIEGSLQIKGITPNFGKYTRGTDFGTIGSPSTKTNVFVWMELRVKDTSTGVQIIEAQTQGALDNQT